MASSAASLDPHDLSAAIRWLEAIEEHANMLVTRARARTILDALAVLTLEHAELRDRSLAGESK